MNISPKLALFLPSMRGGGAERVMFNLANAFAASGIHVDLVVAQAEGPYLKQLSPGVHLVDLEAPRISSSLFKLRAYLRSSRPDALLSAMTHSNVIALIAGKLAGGSSRIFISEHDAPPLEMWKRSPRHRLNDYLARLLYSGAAGVVAVSSGVADYVTDLWRVNRQAITVIFNPVVTDELRDACRITPDHPWFADGQPPVVLSVGRLTKQKDFPTLVRAFAKVRSATEARLMILGKGTDLEALQALADELGVGQHVAFPGFVDNPFSYMAKAGVFVLSSAWEGMGNVLVEAMACGTPVVSTDCRSGPAEILCNGAHGKLVPVGDDQAMSQAILDELRRHSFDPAAVEERTRDFTLDTIASQYRALLLPKAGA